MDAAGEGVSADRVCETVPPSAEIRSPQCPQNVASGGMGSRHAGQGLLDDDENDMVDPC